jgi:hypothetical protein
MSDEMSNNMMRASRLFEDFRMQTKETMLEHMDKLALNQNVYSSLVKGFDPYLKECLTSKPKKS